jgi:hypothetical protein
VEAVFAIAALVAILIGLLPILWAVRNKLALAKHKAIAIGLGVLIWLLCAFALSVLVPNIRSARFAATYVGCMQNIHAINKALVMYAGENDDKYPGYDWCDSLSQYMYQESFACPMSDAEYSYCMNEDLIGRRSSAFRAPPVVTVFDGRGYKNDSGDISSAVMRHDGEVALVGYSDGKVRPKSR